MLRPNINTVKAILVVSLFGWVSVLFSRKVHDFWSARSVKAEAEAHLSSVLRTLPDNRKPVLGTPVAPFKIIEFSDYQCPYCSRANLILLKFAASHPDGVAVYRYDMPLQQLHPYAYKAAIAANCASFQGIGAPYQALLFEHHNKLGTLDFSALAKKAGITDTQGFIKCLQSDAPRERIRNDLQKSKSLGLEATPSFIVAGNMLSGSITIDKLDDLYKKTESGNR